MAGRKKSTEEVKVEKKFCTKCGRELNEGEVCNCTEVKPEVKVTQDAILGYGKELLNTIIDMFKKPEETIEAKIKSNKTSHNMLILGAIAISFGLYFTGAFASILKFLSAFIQINIADVIVIPYFKIFLFMGIINFVLAFIPIGVAFLGTKIFNGKNSDFKTILTLYAVSYAPTIFTNLLMFITSYFNILGVIGAIIGLVMGIVCFFNFTLGYLKIEEFKVNLKAYAISTVWIVSALLYMAIMITCLDNFVGGMAKDLDYTNNDSYFDRIDW